MGLGWPVVARPPDPRRASAPQSPRLKLPRIVASVLLTSAFFLSTASSKPSYHRVAPRRVASRRLSVGPTHCDNQPPRTYLTIASSVPNRSDPFRCVALRSFVLLRYSQSRLLVPLLYASWRTHFLNAAPRAATDFCRFYAPLPLPPPPVCIKRPLADQSFTSTRSNHNSIPIPSDSTRSPSGHLHSRALGTRQLRSSNLSISIRFQLVNARPFPHA